MSFASLRSSDSIGSLQAAHTQHSRTTVYDSQGVGPPRSCIQPHVVWYRPARIRRRKERDEARAGPNKVLVRVAVSDARGGRPVNEQAHDDIVAKVWAAADDQACCAARRLPIRNVCGSDLP